MLAARVQVWLWTARPGLLITLAVSVAAAFAVLALVLILAFPGAPCHLRVPVDPRRRLPFPACAPP